VDQLESDCISKARALQPPPIAIEAFWDGDTRGWFVVLAAIIPGGSSFTTIDLCVLSDGGDIRLFNGTVPPWPEARRAVALGNRVASVLEVPFFFAAPDHPELDSPRWWQRDRAQPCDRCATLLLPDRAGLRRSLCSTCSAHAAREAKEAAWTDAERAGPRCRTCGNPAKGELDSEPVCVTCLERYEVYRCTSCGVRVMVSRTLRQGDFCSECELRGRLAALSKAERVSIVRAAETGGHIQGILAAKELLRCGIGDAESVLELVLAADAKE
jgi:hypothetical protein